MSVYRWNRYGVKNFYTEEFLDEMLQTMYENPTWLEKRKVKKELKKMDKEIRKNYIDSAFVLDFRKVDRQLAFNRVYLYMLTRDDLLTYVDNKDGTYIFCRLMG